MPFDEIPENIREEYPCECGGTISLYDNTWKCDTCDFKRPNPNKKRSARKPNSFYKKVKASNDG